MSKILTSPILYTHTDTWGNSAFTGTAHEKSYPARRIWWFCASEFRDHFDVPKTATKVWLEFYSTPAPGRYKAESRDGLAYLDGRHIEVMMRVVKMIVRRVKGTVCYVECHYE